MTRTRVFVVGCIVALGAFVATGCSDSPVSPGVNPEVANLTDTFQFQVTSMANYTQTLSYSWENTGTVANVDQSCAITDGSGTLVLLDANGTQVYSRNLNLGGSMSSTTGVAGTWTIRVSFTNTDGTINFRAQKA